jgi:hypothetical protein
MAQNIATLPKNSIRGSLLTTSIIVSRLRQLEMIQPRGARQPGNWILGFQNRLIYFRPICMDA